MDTKREYFPPKIADRFLEFYCNPEKLEQIQGDSYEIFYLNLSEKGLSYARFRYFIHVLSFFRWANIKKTKPTYESFTNTAMLKNYFKIAWRNLLKQKTTTFISVFGLACAVGCCLVAYLFIQGVWLKGMLQPNKNEIYQLTYTVEEDEGKVVYGSVAEPIAELLDEQFVQIKAQTRIRNGFPILIYKNESYNQRVLYVDPGYMEMFSYDMRYGYSKALDDPNQVILTYELSEKLFGETPPIGQEITLVNRGEEIRFKVGGVLEKLNDMDMFNFDMLLNIDNVTEVGTEISTKDSWDSELWTFVQLDENSSPLSLQNGLEEIRKTQNQINPDNPYLNLELVAYTDLVYQIGKIENGVRDFLGLGPQLLLGAIGLFVLILAVFNYINISILMASKRLKEIGIRKVIGSRRSQLILQFLNENMIVCALAIFTGCLLAVFIFLPGFNQIASKSLTIDLLNDPYIWVFLAGLTVFITLASGLYPAVFVSSFQPVAILKGNEKLGSKSILTSILLTFQFTLAIISIVAGIALAQTNYLNSIRAWGYDSSDKIIVNIPDTEEYITLKDRLSAIGAVEGVSGSHHYVGNWLDQAAVAYEDREFEVDLLRGDANYPEILGLNLISGRFLSEDRASDLKENILVNETFMSDWGLTFPVEEPILMDSIKYQIVGVVQDFHTEFFQRPMAPTVIRATPDSAFNYLTLKMSPGTASSSMELIKESWRESFPKGLFEGKLQDNVFEMAQRDVKGIQKIIVFAGILAVLLSAMGLYGLVSLNMNSRLKDFCVRKVFGAETTDLSMKLFKKYLISWAIAAVIGSGLAIVMIQGFLDSFFAYHAGVGLLPISFGILFLLLVIGLTVSSQLWKVIKSNPAKVLKSE